MSIFSRLASALGAATARTKFGGLQGVLKERLKLHPVDAPEVQQLASRATAIAWRIPIVSAFFRNHGFSYDDYDSMYRGLLKAFPDRLIDRNLLATAIMVDRFDQLAPTFQAIAEAASTTEGDARAQLVSTMLVDFVRG